MALSGTPQHQFDRLLGYRRRTVSPVPVISLVLASLAALLHVYFFVLESLVFRRPFAHRAFGARAEDVETLEFAMYNQGFYNLFLALGTFVGVIGVLRDWQPQGTTLVVFCTACMVAAALVLVANVASAQDKVARGAAVYAEQKCQLCHSIAGKGNAKGPLDGVGTKHSAADLKAWIVDAKGMTAKTKATRKPEMKSYSLPKEDVDALVAYLSSLKK